MATTARIAKIGRGVSGSLTAGLAILTIVVIGAQVYSSMRNLPGPGPEMMIGHIFAAMLAITGQRIADRTDGLIAFISATAAVVITFLTLWLFWWM